MYRQCRQVRSQSAKTPEEIRSICKHLHTPVPEVYEEEYEVDRNDHIDTTKRILGEECMSDNDFLHSKTYEPVIDDVFSSLEESHFASAISHGFFNGVAAQNKRDRKKRYRSKKNSNKITNSKTNRTEISDSEKHIKENYDRAVDEYQPYATKYDKETGIFKNIPSPCSTPEHKPRRRKSQQNPGDQICRELTIGGMDIIGMSDSMEIEEIHALQERFFSSLSMKDGYSMGKSKRSNSVF